MNILVTGASGFIGFAFLSLLKEQGHTATPLARRTEHTPGEPSWDPDAGRISLDGCGYLDGVVHLAGENIAAGRWSPERKQRIRDSRVSGTALLAEAVAALDPRPPVFLSASAIGFYGDQGDTEVSEDTPCGEGFLAELCRDWEAACDAALAAGIRVAHPRFGLVLSRGGGALAQMLPPFKLGLGGTMGHGRQYYSWVTLKDTTRALLHALEHESITGPFNVVSPAPVTNRAFTRALAHALKRPALLPVPAFGARMLLGEMADALLLSGQRVHPKALLETNFTFEHTNIDQALSAIL